MRADYCKFSFCDVPSKMVRFTKTQVSLGFRMEVMATTSEHAQKGYRNKVNKHKPEHTESLPPAEPEQDESSECLSFTGNWGKKRRPHLHSGA